MNIKTIAALATALIASSAFAGSAPDKKCGAGSCGGKKDDAAPADGKAIPVDAAKPADGAAAAKPDDGKKS